MPGLYDYWWLVTSFKSSLRKIETRMFYVANVTTLSVVSELLWKFTLFIRYKLSIFRPPWVNQFDICELLLGGYYSFISLNKMVFYGYCKALPSDSWSMLHIALTLFPFCSGLCCSIFNYPLRIIIVALSATCVDIISLVADPILFSWLLISGDFFNSSISIYCNMRSVLNFLDFLVGIYF